MNKYARDFCKSKKEAKVVKDYFDEGVWIIIMSLHSHFTVYFGVPITHPLAGFGYDDIPLSCHGGLTYSEEGNGKYHSKCFYWYGWDYAHAGDLTYYDLESASRLNRIEEHDWTLEEIEKDLWSPLYDFQKLMKFAESIANKVRK